MRFTLQLMLLGLIAVMVTVQASAGVITKSVNALEARALANGGSEAINHATPAAFVGQFDGVAGARAFVNADGLAAAVSEIGFGVGGAAETVIIASSAQGGPASASSSTSYKIDFVNSGAATPLAYGFTVNNPRLLVVASGAPFLPTAPYLASLGVDVLLDGTLVYEFTANLTVRSTADYDLAVTSSTGGAVPVFTETVLGPGPGKFYQMRADSFTHTVELGLFGVGQGGTIEHIVRSSAYSPLTGGANLVQAGVGDPPFFVGGAVTGTPSSLGPSVVPEPMSLLAFGLIALSGVVHRGRRS